MVSELFEGTLKHGLLVKWYFVVVVHIQHKHLNLLKTLAPFIYKLYTFEESYANLL